MATIIRAEPRPIRRIVSPRLPAWGMAAVVAAVIAWGAPIAVQSWRIDQAAQAIAGDREASERLAARYEDAGERVPPRLALALAAAWTRSAATAQDTDRRMLALANAGQFLDQARSARPVWPSLRVAEAYHAMLMPGRDAAALAAYAASFTGGRFLPREGLWRVAFGARHWQQLRAETRSSMVEEAVLLTQMDGGLRPQIEAILGDSPAAVRFQLRLAAARQVGPQRPAPAETE